MPAKIIQVAGLAFTIAYAAFIVWLYATEPRTFNEIAISAEVSAGTEGAAHEEVRIIAKCRLPIAD